MHDINLLSRTVNLWKRKIFLYGNERIKRDVEYLFRDRGLDIELYDLECNTYLMEASRDDSLLVLCKKEKDPEFEHDAKKVGMKHGEDYLYVQDLFLHYNPMFLERKDRKLAVWGTGICASELWDILDKKGLASEIDFYIDNANDQNTFKGKKVLAPIEIKDRRDIYIVVATSKYPWEIYQQLDEYGFHRKEDYVHYSVIARGYVGLLQKVCFADENYPYFCHRPFGYVDVIGENLHLCCPDFLPVSAGSMSGEFFIDCWNSHIARILRLSILNGTFALCNKQYCDLFDFHQSIETEGVPIDVYNKEPSAYPSTLMVGIDYSCNLRCPSCREDICIASPEERKEMDRKMEDLLEHVIPHVDRLWLAGNGEVFFSDTYKNILEDKRCQERSSISILSNGTLFNEKNWKVLEEAAYKSIEVVISMDGIKDETIEKLRRGANAQKLKQNLKFLGDLRKQGKLEKLFLSCVLQAANIAELHELLDYCQEIGVDKVQFIKLKNNGVYMCDDGQFDEMSVFDEADQLKERYKPYFTDALLSHPLADWFNSTNALQVKKRPRLDEYDTF